MTINQYDNILENITNIKNKVNQALYLSNRPHDDVQIMAVTKTVPAEFVNFAIEHGISLIGESKVQEFLGKIDDYNLNKTNIHFIGNLQKNKVKYIIDKVDMIESVSSVELADKINKTAKQQNRIMDILLEVNIADELSKTGFSKNDLLKSLNILEEMENIKIKGLMCIPPRENSKKFFLQTNQLFVDIKAKTLDNISMSILSMGMSNDFEEAIQCGSNIVRIGTSMFGYRK